MASPSHSSAWLTPLPWTLTSVGLAVLLHARQLPMWVLAAFGVLALWRLILSRRRLPPPSGVVRAIAVAVVLAAVAVTFRTIN
ncbi:MAG TPA: hypothetical protein VLB75_07375, partial [Steroidobacteraceae bacterium]|nr:hypothetical protein [Steroidobacteraceae bacterium]